jgi:hypothetical protein
MMAGFVSETFATDVIEIPGPVNLGNSERFAIIAKAGVTNVKDSIIKGNIGVSPIAQTSLTGFNLVQDVSGMWATSTQVIGNIYSADDISPTPSELTTTVLDMQTAYVDASGRPADYVEHLTGNLGGATLTPGVYKFGTSVNILNDCTISGDESDQWIFQIDGNLDIATSKSIILAGGAKAENIVWVVSGAVTVSVSAHFEGIILGATAAHFRTHSSINGRVLVQTEVTLQMTTIIAPVQST